MLLEVNTRYTHFIVEFKTANFKTHTHIYIYMGHSPENWTEEGAAFLMK